MLRLRLITGPLLIVGLVALMWLDGQVDAVLPDVALVPRGLITMALAALLIVPLAAFEFAALLRGAGVRAPTALAVLAAEVGLVAGAIALRPTMGSTSVPIALATSIVPLALLATAAVAIVTLAWGRRTDGIGGGVGAALFAFAALGIPFAFFLALREWYGAWLLAGVVLTAKSCDIGAYFTGRAIGRHKLIPWLSPGKTWEGLVGGAVTSMIVGGMLAWWSTSTASPVPVVAGAIGGLALGLAGQAGDLAESLLKRSADAKDSGRTIPGMGGLLDVIDSLLPAGVVAALILLAFGVPGG